LTNTIQSDSNIANYEAFSYSSERSRFIRKSFYKICILFPLSRVMQLSLSIVTSNSL